MLTTQDKIDRVVTQTSASEIRFKEPLAAMGIALVGGLMFGAGGLFLLTFSYYNPTYHTSPAITICFGIISIFISLWMFYTSLPHELHLNFQYRKYNALWGFGPFARSHDGSFDEISYVYICKYVDKYGNATFMMGFAFGDADCERSIFTYTRPCYNVLGVRNGDYLRDYAEKLATKMGVAFQDRT